MYMSLVGFKRNTAIFFIFSWGLHQMEGSVCTPQRCPHICADETGAAPVVPAEMRPLNELMLELEGLVGLGQAAVIHVDVGMGQN